MLYLVRMLRHGVVRLMASIKIILGRVPRINMSNKIKGSGDTENRAHGSGLRIQCIAD
jgi:hypothetical protein